MSIVKVSCALRKVAFQVDWDDLGSSSLWKWPYFFISGVFNLVLDVLSNRVGGNHNLPKLFFSDSEAAGLDVKVQVYIFARTTENLRSAVKSISFKGISWPEGTIELSLNVKQQDIVDQPGNCHTAVLLSIVWEETSSIPVPLIKEAVRCRVGMKNEEISSMVVEIPLGFPSRATGKCCKVLNGFCQYLLSYRWILIGSKCSWKNCQTAGESIFG